MDRVYKLSGLLVFFSFLSTALAVCTPFNISNVIAVNVNDPISIDKFIGSPVCWISETFNTLGVVYDIDGKLKIVATALAVIFLTIQTLRLMASGSLDKLSGLVIRILVVTVLIGAGSNITGWMHDAWNATYNASQSRWTGAGGYADDIEALVDSVALLLPEAFYVAATTEIGGATPTAEAGSGVTSSAKSISVISVLTNLSTILILTPFMAYGGIMYLAGLQLLIVILFWDICIVFILMPDGFGWFKRLIGQYFSSILKVLLVPFMFGIVIEMGLERPLANMAAYLQTGLADISQVMADLQTAMPNNALASSMNPFNQNWETFMSTVPAAIGTILATLSTILMGWVMAIIGCILGLGISVYIMNQFAGLITSIFGGFAGGGAMGNPVAQVMNIMRSTNSSVVKAINSTKSVGRTAGGAVQSAGKVVNPRTWQQRAGSLDESLEKAKGAHAATGHFLKTREMPHQVRAREKVAAARTAPPPEKS